MIRLRVIEIARQKGISMGKLSRMSDVSYNTVKRIADDPYYSITTVTLAKLAKALGVPSTELIEDVPEPDE